MKRGYLSEYFDGVALKRLSRVETDPSRSNQHEFNGVSSLRSILGEPNQRVNFPTRFMYLSDFEDDLKVYEGNLTWYDSRRRAREGRNVMRWEYRLYFQSNPVMQIANEGDLLVVAKLKSNSLLAIVAKSGTSIERQISWLFNYLESGTGGFEIKEGLETDRDKVGLTANFILEEIGIEPRYAFDSFLDEMLSKFGGEFPSTEVFSEFARSKVADVSSFDDPDSALFQWMEMEEALFRTLEKHIMSSRLDPLISGDVDVDGIVALVQSALQRRKSRAGLAFENHLERIFKDRKIAYTKNGVTENKHKPDFLFPNITSYQDKTFDAEGLTMLAVKSTCKDRWRQILNEAARISKKHLVTLEPGISTNQTDEMKAENVQLILPAGLHGTYTSSQQAWLMKVGDFIELVAYRQRA